MIILDTNVLSDLMRGGSPETLRWLDTVPRSALHTTAVNRAEIRLGIARLPDGRRKASLADRADAVFAQVEDHVWPFDSAAADRFASVVADRQIAGRPISVADAQIAAIASVRRASLATRNVDDFVACGIVVVDPFEG